ncbi:MAG: response regulator [Pseudoxanthomonas sp.]
MVHANQEIVLVEDDESVRRAMERILRGVGYRVSTFGSAEELLGALDGAAMRQECGCLICDIRLPGLSGFELHRRCQERGRTPPWIFITAHDDPALRKQADRDGAAYLLKPFRGRALLALVAQSMRAA